MSVEASMFQGEADRTFRQMMEAEEVEDLLLLAAVEELPETAPPAQPVEATATVEDEEGSYMVADVEFDKERVSVEFSIPMGAATEFIGHVNNMDDYDEAQYWVNEFAIKLADVMGRAMFGPPAQPLPETPELPREWE